MVAWNTPLAPPPAMPTTSNSVMVSAPTSPPMAFTRPLTILLAGNTKDSMAQFDLPMATAPTAARVGEGYEDAKTPPSRQAEPSLASLQGNPETCWYYDSTAQRLHVRIKLPPSTFPGFSAWGGMFDGQPV